ncbi:MAG: FAD-dependent oxidoreductase [Spirochaetia bacterium]|nr:FAD-dependent oxidoreductase [Spirochaetia bacterium]
MADEKFDAIVVGGGPAGLSAAYVMAKAGMQVIVVERGDYCGSKNVFGGIFFTNVMKELIPDFLKDAPVERNVSKRRFSFLTPTGEVGGGFKFDRFNKEPFNNSFTVLRAKFDRWFSEKVEEAGAMIITGTVVDDFLLKDGKICGVKARMEDGDLYGDVVVLADGVNSLLAKKLGFHNELSAESTIVGVKETIALPEERIRDRFGLTGNEGVAYEYFGMATGGAIGSGFIYTNKDTISVGIGATIKSMLEHKLNPNDVLEAFKAHPVVAPLVRDGEQKEYSAHLIPDGGYDKLSKLYGDNVLVVGDAAGFVNATLFHEGTNLAMESGKLAGQTVVESFNKGKNYSAEALSQYKTRLDNSFAMRDMKQFRGSGKALEHNSKLFGKYAVLMEDVVSELFAVDGEAKWPKEVRLVKKVLTADNPFALLKTALDMRKVIV